MSFTSSDKILKQLSTLLVSTLVANVSIAESAPTESVYVTGATVFLDINYNGRFDLNEPSAITGDYTTDLSATETSCLGYAPIVVDVPLGALDANQLAFSVTRKHPEKFPLV